MVKLIANIEIKAKLLNIIICLCKNKLKNFTKGNKEMKKFHKGTQINKVKGERSKVKNKKFHRETQR
jgi:hypothetical protein